MFNRFKPVPFDPYGRRRSRARVPSWLAWLLAGAAAGAGGVLLVQDRYLPPRLSVAESARLQDAHARADAERERLQARLDDASRQLAAALDRGHAAASQLEASRAEAARLRDEMSSLLASLPQDPRGGPVEVRAGQFVEKNGQLAYDVVLTRGEPATRPVDALMQLTVAGSGARGAAATVDLEPVALQMNGLAILRGSLPLPEGFRARETTVRILDRDGGGRLGMRVLKVR